ncbi:dNA-binding protein ComEA family [Firmicutes bacterium CAG:582]|nr:dNA-binding protein ComEA family [Firmicutes bacterium CAG:582]
MKAKLKYIIIAIIILVALVVSYVLSLDNKEVSAENVEITKTDVTNVTSKVYVDIKGSVKKPGVYQVSADSIVWDIVNLSGGFTKNAYTKNINLSQKVKDEMVIYVFSKNEMLKMNENVKTDTTCTTNIINYDNCITTEKNETSTVLVNINTASKEELMNVSGIGASKADSIIAYRIKTPFSKIEDIMNVSGIGESLFDKIKKYITV